MLDDTTYCEILITDDVLFPYHNNNLNGFEYKYEINNDTFIIFGKNNDIVESSTIYSLGQDSFRIPGITTAVLKRVNRDFDHPHKLATYHYKRNKIFADHDSSIVKIIDNNVFFDMNDLKKVFDKNYQERRVNAIYKIKKQKEAALKNS